MGEHYWIRTVIKDMYNYCKYNDLTEIAIYCELIEVAAYNLPVPQFRPVPLPAKVAVSEVEGDNVIAFRGRVGGALVPLAHQRS